MVQRALINIASVMVIMAEATNALAITPAQAPNFFDAGRVGREVQQTMPNAPMQPATVPQVVHREEKEVPAESKILFKLTKIIVTGNTVYSNQELQKLFAASLNKTISVTDLQELVHKVSTKYRGDGYILSHAILPPQAIKNGVVKVQVIEGFVSDVVVKGGTNREQAMLEKYGKQVMKSHPLNIQVLNRNALIINDLPGFDVRTVLTPSKTVPAGADLTFLTTVKKTSGFVSYDNYGTRYIGPQEASIGGTVNSVFTAGDTNSIRLSETSRPHELNYAEFTHAQPLGVNGTRLLVGINYTETHPGFVLTPADIKGRTNLIYGQMSYPIIRNRELNFYVHSGVNYQIVTSTILGTPLYEDRIRSLNAGASIDNIDHYHGINTVGLDVTHGFNIMGAAYHADQSRINGHSQYTHVNAALSRLQGLTQRFSLFGSVQGQYSYQALLATEQFGFGGSDYGRGYDPSEIVGDNGVAAKFELRLDTYPGKRFLQAVQLYAFYDAGIVWNIDNVNLPGRQDATSTGLGARFTFTPIMAGSFFIGKPLSKKASTLVALGRNSNMARMYFQMTASV